MKETFHWTASLQSGVVFKHTGWIILHKYNSKRDGTREFWSPHLSMLPRLASGTLCGGLQRRSSCPWPSWSPSLWGRCGSSASRLTVLPELDHCHWPLPRPRAQKQFEERNNYSLWTNSWIQLLYITVTDVHQCTLKMRLSVLEESCLKACFHGMQNSVSSWLVHWTPGYLRLSICPRSHGISSGLEWDISNRAKETCPQCNNIKAQFIRLIYYILQIEWNWMRLNYREKIAREYLKSYNGGHQNNRKTYIKGRGDVCHLLFCL